ncbi:unnamed protein product [Medioppia subpectinata]|uniref:Uncharacterized protein n=1 Tax=Medioppia subpectinata TaxID=1979941 RepID=A0A7R9L551_9ACAR|nr:unnamed protein product [Medioppia subpectinata]CAG2115707.1 unnamed protein product [Medioppia subpectinata]
MGFNMGLQLNFDNLCLLPQNVLNEKLGKNLDTMHYRDVIIQLSKKLDELPANGFNDEFDSSESKV